MSIICTCGVPGALFCNGRNGCHFNAVTGEQAKQTEKPMTNNTQLPADDKPSPLITDLLPVQEVHNLYMQERKISSELNKEIKKVREYLFDNFGEFSEAKILSYQNGEKHTVDLVKMVATEYATKLHQVGQEKELWKKESISKTEMLLEARALLEKVIYRHEGGLLPDRLLYNEIKTFLDGTK
jgi:hypothetical protein